jgi:hypothetical protein
MNQATRPLRASAEARAHVTQRVAPALVSSDARSALGVLHHTESTKDYE